MTEKRTYSEWADMVTEIDELKEICVIKNSRISELEARLQAELKRARNLDMECSSLRKQVDDLIEKITNHQCNLTSLPVQE